MCWNDMIVYIIMTKMNYAGFSIDAKKFAGISSIYFPKGDKINLPNIVEAQITKHSKSKKKVVTELELFFYFDQFLCTNHFLEILNKFQINFQFTKAQVRNSKDNKLIDKEYFYGRLLDRFPVLDRKYAEGWDENGNFKGSSAEGDMIIDEKKYLDACKKSDLFLIEESPAWVLASESFYKLLKKEKIFNLIFSPLYTYESWLVEYVERIRNNRIVEPRLKVLAEIKKRPKLLERLYSSTERDWKKYLDELELP